MRIALLGGTGDIGEGLAMRWAYDTDHEVVVGSRDADRGAAKAEEYETELDSRGRERTVEGTANADAAADADVAVLAVPPYYARDTLDAVRDALSAGTVLVSPVVGMGRDEEGTFRHEPPSSVDSLTELVAGSAPEDVPVVGAYHTLPAARLANLDADLGIDVPVVGADEDAKETVATLTDQVEGLRALDAGGFGAAAAVESITPLLRNLAENNEGLHDLSAAFR